MTRSGIRRWLNRHLTLSDQFMVFSFVILLIGMLLIGAWIATGIQNVVIDQSANVTSLYMNTFVTPLLQPLTTRSTLNSDQHKALQRLIVGTPLGQDIVSMKVWSPEGSILFSLTSAQIGTHIDVNTDPQLKLALTGQIVSGLTSLDKPEQAVERGFNIALIETYIPVHANGTNQVIAVAEFYINAEALMNQIRIAQQQSWLVVAIATMIMYGLLSGLFARGTKTIAEQQTALQNSVNNLSALLAENQTLNERLQHAAARASEINEQFLQRIGRDLHDGPAQDLALALLRLDEICATQPGKGETIRTALQSALKEIRGLAGGLQLPELEPLTTPDVARRAVREFQRKTGGVPDLSMDETLPTLPLLSKIALYRVIVEALNNSLRHAHGKGMRVHVKAVDHQLLVDVCDSGPGFDPANIDKSEDHLGLAGLQQRVALLGGSFEIESTVDTGTCIRAKLPTKGESHV